MRPFFGTRRSVFVVRSTLLRKNPCHPFIRAISDSDIDGMLNLLDRQGTAPTGPIPFFLALLYIFGPYRADHESYGAAGFLIK